MAKQHRTRRARPIKLEGPLREKLTDRRLVPNSITIGTKSFNVQEPVGAGVTGAVWHCRDEHGRDRAIKLCIREHYNDRSYQEEMARAALLERYSSFAKLIDAGIAQITFNDSKVHSFVAFIEEWVPGYTFKDFLASKQELHSVSTFRAFVAAFASILSALEAAGLRHDDLNPGNIMIVPPAHGDLENVFSIKIVDLASLKSASKPQRKPRNDHDWMATHLVSFWNAIVAKKIVSTKDRSFLSEAESLIRAMLEDDPSRKLSIPSQIKAGFEEAYRRSLHPKDLGVATLTDPFDFISAEHIYDDRLLVRLFANSCPWLGKVSSPDPCIITGPRGCGKSTIFRWMSLKAQLLSHPDWTGDKIAAAASLFGFYVSCSSDLQNKLSWIRSDGMAKTFENEIIHYFNIIVSREIVNTLIILRQRPDCQTFWGLDEAKERTINDFLFSQFGSPAISRLQGVSPIEQALDMLDREAYKCYIEMNQRRNLPITTSPALLGDFSSVMVREFPRLRDKRIAFLLDDFSIHRISESVQRVLNRVIWERRSSHVFKLSSEKYGAILHDEANATADLAREMVEIDCGQEFIALDDFEKQSDAVRFAEELLDNRLSEAGYKGRVATLIGSSEWEGSLARALRAEKLGRINNQYHGIECISQLCSGDVSSLLLVYRNIFSHAKTTNNDCDRISKETQHAAIRQVSQRMFDRIRTYIPFGPEMYAVVNSFGKLVRKILADGQEISHGKGNARVPSQCPRIEIDQTSGSVPDQLTGTQHDLARELIRRAIFIEMEPGLSRHQNATSLRWQIRRIFLPTFNAALAKNDAVKRSPDWFKFFLSNPEEACSAVWRQWNKDEGTLFDGVHESSSDTRSKE